MLSFSQRCEGGGAEQVQGCMNADDGKHRASN